jgi:signal transduction histidine kinase/PAS domain-containing protein
MTEAKFNHELFAELYDVQPQAIFWLRPKHQSDSNKIIDFEYVYANDEGLKYLNISRTRFKGLTILNSTTLTDELRYAVYEEMLNVYSTGNKSETSIFNPALNKYTRVLRTRVRDGILNVLQDITGERKIILRLEEQSHQLEEQKNLLDNILKNSSNGISVSEVFRDENGKVVDALTIMANDAAVNYMGFPREIYLTKRATEIEPGVIGSPYYQACIKTLETGEPFKMQYYVEATKRWLELSVSKLDYNHLIQVFTDVSHVQEVQLQLEKAATTLKSVFDAAQTGMFTFSPEFNEKNEIVDFRFGMVNTTVAGFAGLSPQQLEGQLGVKWFPGYISNGEFDLYKFCYETGEPVRKELFYHFSGRDFFLDLQCLKMGEQLLITMTDHTTLRKSQLELEQTIKALELSNTHLEDFAHAASHDLKEPLRKIRTFTDRLKSTLEEKMTEAEMALFRRIEVAAERMQLLVDDLLEFSHVSEKPQKMEIVDLTEKVQRVLTDLELPIEEKCAIIKLDPLPIIQGNRRQLQQLFQNLISNALKYSKPDIAPEVTIGYRIINGGDVEISIPQDYKDKKFHLIEVTDNGIGFEQEYAEQIFKMFQRLHGKTEFAGTGVGLSIVRKVVENHNGYIWAKSEPGKGARFSVLLPHS